MQIGDKVYILNRDTNNIIETHITDISFRTVSVDYGDKEFYTGIDTPDNELLSVIDEPYVLFETKEAAKLASERRYLLRFMYQLNAYNVPTAILKEVVTRLERYV